MHPLNHCTITTHLLPPKFPMPIYSRDLLFSTSLIFLELESWYCMLVPASLIFLNYVTLSCVFSICHKSNNDTVIHNVIIICLSLPQKFQTMSFILFIIDRGPMVIMQVTSLKGHLIENGMMPSM